MKIIHRKITASYDWDDSEYDDIPSFNHDSETMVRAIADYLHISDDIADIIYNWYDLEDAWEDFDSVQDFLSYMEHDVYDMLDACDDPDEAERVRRAIEVDM